VTPTSLARVKFGKTGLMAPPIAVGCAEIGDMPDAFAHAVSEEDAKATVRAFLNSPLNYIDTAALYGNGESERRVGLVLRELGGLPEGAILQTKQGRDPETDDYSGETVKRRFERSLQLLGVDKVHVCYLHDAEWTTFSAAMAPGGPVEVLREYQRQGAIDFLGVASGPVNVELQYIETGLFDAVITHNRYTLLNRSGLPAHAAAKSRGMAVLNAAPYGSGLLAKGPDAYPRYAYQTASDEMLALTRQIDAICKRFDVPLAAAALQFSLRDELVDVTIVGMSKAKRIQQTIDLAVHPIPAELWEELAQLPFFSEDPEIGRFTKPRPGAGET
jgi:D-threo-aldose 1-dehydrogenase